MQESTEFADESHQNGETGRPGHHHRVVVLGQHHRAGHFAVGGYRRAAEQADDIDRQSVAKQGAVESGRGGEVLAGHRADGQDAANVLDDRRNRHRNHEQDRRQIEFRLAEFRYGQPGRLRHLAEIDDADEQRVEVADGNADQDRHQFQQAPGADRRQHRCQQRDCRSRDRQAVGHDLLITGLAGGHIDGDLRQSQTDHHHYRANYHRWQQAMDEADTPPFDQRRGDIVKKTGRSQCTEGCRHSPGLYGIDDRRDEGKAGTEVDRYFAAGAQLEN